MWTPKLILMTLLSISSEFVTAQNSGSGPLTSESVSEGPCDPDIGKRGARIIDINPLFFASTRNYYIPIASEACFRGYAEVLLGRPAESQDELDSMKLRIRAVFPLPPIFVTSGFLNQSSGQSVQITQACPPANLQNQILCRPVASFNSPGTNTTGIETSQDTTYYTDNNSTILIIRCLNKKVRDYKVLTTGPEVTPATREVLLSKITELGFDPKRFSTMKY